MRLFVAIDLDDNSYFKQIQEQIPSDIRATFPSQFHLTLKFLGETDKQDDIVAELSKIKFKPFKIKTTQIGVFPSEQYIQVVWLGLDDNPALFELQKNVDKVLEGFNFKKDYDFKPHITLARIKFLKPEQKKELVARINGIKFEQKTFMVNEFKLIKSELSGEGPKYIDVKVFSA